MLAPVISSLHEIYCMIYPTVKNGNVLQRGAKTKADEVYSIDGVFAVTL